MQTGWILGILIFGFSTMIISVFFAVLGITKQQFFYTFNDLTFLETKKNIYTESHYCCCFPFDNELRTVSLDILNYI